ncbi:MAG: A/G-specific adenine glycosylase [Phycisphaerales bacterium]
MPRKPPPTSPAQARHAVGHSRDRAITRAIESWFRANARDLPWRRPAGRDLQQNGWRRDPYRSLVSEAMLQQTQVSRVIDRYTAFIKRFPTVQSLARADELDVLAMWDGLGYYRRARHLHAAARLIASEFDDKIPRDVQRLRRLPGVGAYTAGAIASMAAGQREALADGNVVRVLLRIDGRNGRTGDKATLDWTWARARALVSACNNPALFNEGVMELGALVCTPARPACAGCPMRPSCRAGAEGRAALIPRPRRAPHRSLVFSDSILIIDSLGRVLMQQRPAAGMWSSMWQALCIESTTRHAGEKTITRAMERLGIGPLGVTPLLTFSHTTSHREISFRSWIARLSRAHRLAPARDAGLRVLPLTAALRLPISSAQRRILEAARRDGA